MFVFKVLIHPLNEVVLEHSFDELVEQVRSDKFIYICVQKVLCERLSDMSFGLQITQINE